MPRALEEKLQAGGFDRFGQDDDVVLFDAGERATTFDARYHRTCEVRVEGARVVEQLAPVDIERELLRDDRCKWRGNPDHFASGTDVWCHHDSPPCSFGDVNEELSEGGVVLDEEHDRRVRRENLQRATADTGPV